MLSIYDLKPAFQNLLRPLVRFLARQGVRANHITITAIVLSLAIGGAILRWPDIRWPLLSLPLVLFLRMGLNAIDGMLAREHTMKTNLGAILNELGDVISDVSMYLPFAAMTGISAPLVVIIVVLAITGEMTGVVAIQISGVRRYDGPMGKSDRAFVFGAIALALGLGFRPYFWVNLVLTSVILFLLLTIFNRAHQALKGATIAN